MSQTDTAHDTDTITEYVEGNSTGYTAMLQRVDPDDHPDVEKQGYHSPFVLYTIFAGAEVYSHHDRHKLVRQLPGDNRDWLHDHLRRLKDELL
jgi:hypothetical protein